MASWWKAVPSHIWPSVEKDATDLVMLRTQREGRYDVNFPPKMRAFNLDAMHKCNPLSQIKIIK